MGYKLVLWLLKKISAFLSRKQSTSTKQVKTKPFVADLLEEGRQYVIYYKTLDPTVLSEIDYTVGFFLCVLLQKNKRPSSVEFNKEEYVLTVSRKGFDTYTGKPYLLEMDIMESDILKAVDAEGD
jgi:hypothetical protein